MKIIIKYKSEERINLPIFANYIHFFKSRHGCKKQILAFFTWFVPTNPQSHGLLLLCMFQNTFHLTVVISFTRNLRYDCIFYRLFMFERYKIVFGALVFLLALTVSLAIGVIVLATRKGKQIK